MPGDIHDKHSTYWALLKLLFLSSRRLGIGAGLLVVFVTDVLQACQLLPPAYSFEDSHVLVIRVVATAQRVEDVAESLLSLEMLLVFALERLESVGMFYERLIQS